MTQLHETAKQANVVGSLYKYVTDELGDVLSSSAALMTTPAIDYGGGAGFSDESYAEWIQVRPLGMARPAAMMGPYAHRVGEQDPNARGGEGFWLLNVNCFVRPARIEPQDFLRLWKLVDTVKAPLMPGSRVVVKDHAGEGETVGYLFVDEIMEDRPVSDPERADLEQHNLVFALRWVETWVVEQ